MIEQEKLDKYVVVLALKLIQTNEAFREDFLKIAGSIYADVISFTANSNCSCRGKVVRFIVDNQVVVKNMLSSWESKEGNDITPLLSEAEQEFVSKVNEVRLDGRVFHIEKTEQAYNELIKSISPAGQKALFRGLSVLDTGDKWAIFTF